MISNSTCDLINIEPTSLEQLRQWRNNPELRQYFCEYREINTDMQQRWYQDKVLNDMNWIHFEIHTKGSRLIGYCGLHINWVYSNAEFSIHIGDKNYLGQGIGTNALHSLLNHGFNYLNLHRIWCEVYSNNISAANMYRRIGFIDEGQKREAYFCKGKYHNVILMGLLCNEFNI